MSLTDSLVYIVLLFITVSHSETTDDSVVIFPDTYEAMIRSNHTTPPPINHTEAECLTCGSYLEQCRIPVSPTVKYECYNRGVEVPCIGNVQPGTIVSFSCKSYHYYTGYKYNMTCMESGCFDNPTPRCRADCGVRAAPKQPQRLKRDNEDGTKPGEFPWQVALYRLDTYDEEKKTFICAGILVSNHLVITSGHCVYDRHLGTIEPADIFRVAVGKVHRAWSHPQDKYNDYAQKSQVKSIHVPQDYKGEKNYYWHNIAVLEMDKIFTLSDHVRPICLDLHNDAFNEIQLTPGTIGIVAGWGLTEDGKPSDLLQDLEVPVIGMDVCRTEMAKYNFLPYLNSDTLCAGYTTGSALCNGDNGGALAIPVKSVDNIQRWYLRGIVGIGPINPETLSCRADTYTVYTKVYELKEFLLKEFFELNFFLD